MTNLEIISISVISVNYYFDPIVMDMECETGRENPKFAKAKTNIK